MPLPSEQSRLAVIGDRIAHSLSPLLQNTMIEHFDLPFVYEAMQISAERLGEVIERLRRGELRGINVTIPHKQTIIPLLDDLVAPADQIGAVNTVVNSQGKLVGYNTDAVGFTKSLLAAGLSAAHEHVLVLGAGGAAAAVIFALLAEGAAAIFLCNRSAERTQLFMQRIPTAYQNKVRVIAWQNREDWLRLRPVSMIVNTTSVGMYPEIDDSPLPAALFDAEVVAIDLVYNPIETTFLRFARQAGATTLHGLPMLIFQGVAALELWSGRQLDIREIYTELEGALISELHAKQVKSDFADHID